jgi:hypothetical protein
MYIVLFRNICKIMFVCYKCHFFFIIWYVGWIWIERIMAQLAEWIQMTVWGWQVCGTPCMQSHSSCHPPLDVTASIYCTRIRLISIAFSPLLVPSKLYSDIVLVTLFLFYCSLVQFVPNIHAGLDSLGFVYCLTISRLNIFGFFYCLMYL